VLNLCRTSAGLHRATVHQVFLHRRIHASVERLIEELQQPQFGSEEMANCHMSEALTWIYRGTDIGSAVLPETQAKVAASAENGLAFLAARFIQESFDSPLNLEVIARAAGTNKSQLCREFRREYNTTVMEHVSRVRVDASKRLLQARMRVADVAQFVGFPDPYHFSRVFKKIAGQSPKQFSDSQRGQGDISADIAPVQIPQGKPTIKPIHPNRSSSMVDRVRNP
jgi:AraC-like DNA-binding protein